MHCEVETYDYSTLYLDLSLRKFVIRVCVFRANYTAMLTQEQWEHKARDFFLGNREIIICTKSI